MGIETKMGVHAGSINTHEEQSKSAHWELIDLNEMNKKYVYVCDKTMVTATIRYKHLQRMTQKPNLERLKLSWKNKEAKLVSFMVLIFLKGL